jgi:NAD(P)-dependent dehydrogenase (short-subunit alcohol dehydrogenase family)
VLRREWEDLQQFSLRRKGPTLSLFLDPLKSLKLPSNSSRYSSNFTTVPRQLSDQKQAAAIDPSKQRFHYISADLTNPDDADRILDETIKWNNGVELDAIWCCAGYFIDVPMQTLRDQMDTVYWTSAYTAHATLRRLLAPITSSGPNLSSSPGILFSRLPL